MASWIFQANPDYYRVAPAVASFTIITWLANQHAAEMRAGDRVFMWESGRAAGVVGIAEILEPPSMLPPDHPDSEFYLERERFEGLRLRVPLRIVSPLVPRIRRSVIAEDPTLAGMSLFRFSQATNFPLTQEERDALDGMIRRTLLDRIAEDAKRSG